MRQEDISAFQSLFTESVADRPIGSVDDARYALENDFNGDPSSRLFELTITTVDTGFSIKTLRDLEKHFTLAGVIDGTSGEIADVLSHICAHTPGVANPDGSQIRSGPLVPGEQAQHVQTFIKRFDSDDWIEAVLLGRLFAVIGQYPCINAQTRAVADAAVRLKASGFSLSIELGIVQISRPEMERITTRVGVSLRQLGLYDALANVIGLASDNYKYAYDQFLFGRRYGSGLGNRAPSLPVGFLYNLAVKAPSHSALAVPNRNKVWQDAVELARDFLAVLDLEPYSQFAMLGVDATRLENSLRRVAQYDHCFGLRQWQLSFTVEFLEHFLRHLVRCRPASKSGLDCAGCRAPSAVCVTACGHANDWLRRRPVDDRFGPQQRRTVCHVAFLRSCRRECEPRVPIPFRYRRHGRDLQAVASHREPAPIAAYRFSPWARVLRSDLRGTQKDQKGRCAGQVEG